MRPAGEVRQALLQAARELCANGARATMRELAARAQVGHGAARDTVREMRRSGQLRPAGQRPVVYRNRPVTEYELALSAPSAGATASAALTQALGTWTD